jgi:hypothetical protein
VPRARLVEVEAVGVLHQELAAAHHAEARADLVAELPLDVVERARQVAVALHRVAEDGGDHLLVGRAVEHLALVPVADAQHLRAVGVVAAALAPQVGRLDGRHQQLDRAGAVLLLAHDLLDLLEHPKAERQPGVDAGGGLADEAGAQHQLVADDLGVGGRFLGDGGGIVNLPAIFIIAVVAGLLILGTKESATLNAVLVLVKIAALIVFVAVAFPISTPPISSRSCPSASARAACRARRSA